METIDIHIDEERCEQRAVHAIGTVLRDAGWRYETAVMLATSAKRLAELARVLGQAKAEFGEAVQEFVRRVAASGDDPREIDGDVYQGLAESVFARCGSRLGIKIHREECQ